MGCPNSAHCQCCFSFLRCPLLTHDHDVPRLLQRLTFRATGNNGAPSRTAKPRPRGTSHVKDSEAETCDRKKNKLREVTQIPNDIPRTTVKTLLMLYDRPDCQETSPSDRTHNTCLPRLRTAGKERCRQASPPRRPLTHAEIRGPETTPVFTVTEPGVTEPDEQLSCATPAARVSSPRLLQPRLASEAALLLVRTCSPQRDVGCGSCPPAGVPNWLHKQDLITALLA